MPLLGIEIGGTKLQLVVGDENGRIAERKKLAVVPRRGADGIRRQIESALPALVRSHEITAAGVGFGGPVDWRSGRICRSHQIEGWSEFDLAGWLHKLTRAPVHVDNDANVAALGEASLGAGAGCDPVFYVTLGSGVGGGLVTAGRIYHGAIPGEAEIGHVRLDRKGTTVESRCSGWAVDKKVRKLVKQKPRSLFARLAHERCVPGGEAQLLPKAFRSGDAVAKQILRELAEDLAFGLSHVTHLFHPQVIILGGGLSKIGEPLRGSVEQMLLRFLMEAFLPGPKVRLAALGEDAVPLGALLLASGES